MEPEGSLPQSQVPPPVPILSQLDPVHTPTSQLLKLHLNIFLPSTPGSLSRSLSLMYTSLLSPIRAKCPGYLILLDLITRIILGKQYRSLSLSICSFLHSPFTSSHLGPNILFNTLFTNTTFTKILF